jgi:hypothetical protein
MATVLCLSIVLKYYWFVIEIKNLVYCDMMAKSQSRGMNENSCCYAKDGQHVSTAMNQHTTIEEMLEVVFFMLSMLRLYNEDQWGNLVT